MPGEIFERTRALARNLRLLSGGRPGQHGKLPPCSSDDQIQPSHWCETHQCRSRLQGACGVAHIPYAGIGIRHQDCRMQNASWGFTLVIMIIAPLHSWSGWILSVLPFKKSGSGREEINIQLNYYHSSRSPGQCRSPVCLATPSSLGWAAHLVGRAWNAMAAGSRLLT